MVYMAAPRRAEPSEPAQPFLWHKKDAAANWISVELGQPQIKAVSQSSPSSSRFQAPMLAIGL